MTSCRVCYLECNASISLNNVFEEITKSVTYLEALNLCTALEASVNDGLPQYLCLTCSLELQSSYEFLQRAKTTDALLRNGLTQSANVLNFENDNETAVFHVNSYHKDPLENAIGDDDEIFNINSIKSDLQTDWYRSEDDHSDNDQDEDEDEDSKPLKCLLCKEKTIKLETETKKSIEKELIVPTEDQIFPQGQFQCKICEKNYFTLVGLNAHNDIHLPKRISIKKKGQRKSGRRTKITIDTNRESATGTNDDLRSNNESCSISEAKITNKRRKDKPPKPKKLFPCHVCGKHMISASKLRYHMVMHTGEKNYLCTQCPKAYSTIYALKHHIRTHTGERPYECKFCGDKFLRPTTLKSHMRRHTGERPYGCSVCGKRFIQHSSMTTHMKLNHMAKTIHCPHCEKKYARQTDLNTHLLSHTGNKPFFCTLCPSRFIRQANLNKHLNQQHWGKCANSNSQKRTSKNKKTAKTESSVAIDDVLQNDVAIQDTEMSNAVLNSTEYSGKVDNDLPMIPSMCFMKPNNMEFTTNLNTVTENEILSTMNRETNASSDMNRWDWPNQS